jgi:serine O-acetyltransferase
MRRLIQSKNDYIQYLEADRIALGRSKPTLFASLYRVLYPDYIWDFQRLLRKMEYLTNVKSEGIINKIINLYFKRKFRELSLKLGFTIPVNVFGQGLSIVHYGAIVVNSNARIGVNCRIHVDTNIGASGGSNKAPKIGDNVYIAPGVKIFGDVEIGSNNAIGANSVVNKSFEASGLLIAGVPARIIKPIEIKELIRHV